jgi:hypothetical protein
MEESIGAGRVQGRAQALLDLLACRGVPVTDAIRETILSCTGVDQLGSGGRSRRPPPAMSSPPRPPPRRLAPGAKTWLRVQGPC